MEKQIVRTESGCTAYIKLEKTNFEFKCTWAENLKAESYELSNERINKPKLKFVCVARVKNAIARPPKAWYEVEIDEPNTQTDIAVDPGDYYFWDTFDYDEWLDSELERRLRYKLEDKTETEEN
jgi:hypothetical protein